MKKIALVIFILLFLIKSAFSQSCSYDTSSEAGPYNASTVTWVAAGGASCPPSSTFTGDVFIDVSGGDTFVWNYDLTMTGDFDITLANGSTIQFDNNLDVTGNIPVVNSGNSDLVISTTSTINVIAGTNGDMGDPTNNNVTFTVEGTLNVDGTLSSKNGTVFGGSGGISAGTIDLGGASCDAGGCPTITSPTCTGDPTFCSGNVTPIILASFNVFSNTTSVIVNWSTASEENNDYFTIERSADGSQFHEIAIIPGAGNSFEMLDYSYSDNNPFEGVSYYRLKQTDYDGTSETFKVAAVEFYGEADAIKVIQQASNTNELKVYSNLDEENTATIYDVMGRIIKSFRLQQGVNTLDLSVFSNQSGIYIIRITNALGNELKTERFLIK